jgi:hypothetical protein
MYNHQSFKKTRLLINLPLNFFNQAFTDTYSKIYLDHRKNELKGNK